ncbi:MAG TPA: MJ0042-type zinc finger domain-containing protein [Planctomycetaceae bacterium]|nr:MJ0042-type zinc finger domain-containing protein [Planctomycetaceae bacterium]
MSTTLLTRCPHCGARFKLKDESAAGKKMKCRECETPFTIKLAGSAAAVSTRARSRPQAADGDGSDEFDEFDDQDLGGGAPPRLPPRRSKKKKSQRKPAAAPAREEPVARAKPPANIGAMVRLGGGSVLGVGVLAALYFVFFQPSAPIEPPAAWGTFEHPKNAFRCEFPDGWEQSVASGEVSSGRWEKGSAKIYIRMGRASGALSDLARIGADPNEDDESMTPSARLHEDPLIKNPVTDEYSNYEELSVSTVPSKLGDVRLSEFKASGWRGFRATTIGGQGVLRIVCHCRESDWDVCRPIFDRVIRSLAH